MHITELQEWVDQLLTEKGFKQEFQELETLAGRDQLGYKMGALLATEPAEYIDAIKKRKGVSEELEEAADTIIRAMNIFIMNGASAEEVIMNKMKKNFGRPFLYGTKS